MTVAIGLRMVLYAALGVMIGAGYFSALAWNVRLYVDRAGGVKALFLHLVRLAVAAAAFAVCAKRGAAPMIACFVGFLAMRTISINRYRLALERNP
jgi:F1F0 ATPase subunit 2